MSDCLIYLARVHVRVQLSIFNAQYCLHELLLNVQFCVCVCARVFVHNADLYVFCKSCFIGPIAYYHVYTWNVSTYSTIYRLPMHVYTILGCH